MTALGIKARFYPRSTVWVLRIWKFEFRYEVKS